MTLSSGDLTIHTLWELYRIERALEGRHGRCCLGALALPVHRESAVLQTNHTNMQPLSQ